MSDWKTINNAKIDLDDPSNPVTGTGKMTSLHSSNQNKPKGKKSPDNKPKSKTSTKSVNKTLTSNKTGGNLNKTKFITPTESKSIEESKAFEKAITPTQYEAVKTYTGSSYSTINGYLRGRDGYQNISSSMKQVIKNANTALKSYELKEDIKVFRNVGSKGAEVIKQAFTSGQPFVEKGFMSTSIDKNVFGSSSCHIEVEVPKGKGRGAYVQTISHFESEKEFLIPSGMSFDVVEYDDSDKWDIKVKLRMRVK